MSEDEHRSTSGLTTSAASTLGRLKVALVVLTTFYCVGLVVRNGSPVRGRWQPLLFDDAMISMRYARNLAEGSGLLFNAGDPAVQGYTNLLWTLWMAVLHLLGLDGFQISLAIQVSGLACVVTVIGILVSWRPGGLDPRAKIGAGVVVSVKFCNEKNKARQRV